jgi:hypothetical protein
MFFTAGGAPHRKALPRCPPPRAAAMEYWLPKGAVAPLAPLAASMPKGAVAPLAPLAASMPKGAELPRAPAWPGTPPRMGGGGLRSWPSAILRVTVLRYSVPSRCECSMAGGRPEGGAAAAVEGRAGAAPDAAEGGCSAALTPLLRDKRDSLGSVDAMGRSALYTTLLCAKGEEKAAPLAHSALETPSPERPASKALVGNQGRLCKSAAAFWAVA